MKISFTGLTNPHMYIGKEQFIPVKLRYSNGYSMDAIARYQPAKFTCELTDDENGHDLHKFKSDVKLLHLDKYVDKENTNKITANIGFYHIKGTENRFCKFSLNGQEINNRKTIDLYLFSKLSEIAKLFGRSKDLTTKQRGYFNAMSIAYDQEIYNYRIDKSLSL